MSEREVERVLVALRRVVNAILNGHRLTRERVRALHREEARLQRLLCEEFERREMEDVG